MFVVALVTPKTINRWTEEELIDYQSLERLVSYLSLYFDNFLFLGFTGEFNLLSLKEAIDIIKFAKEFKWKREKKVIINITRPNKEETEKLIKESYFADFLMILFPYKDISYDDGIRIIKENNKPFIFYNSQLINLTKKEIEKILKEKNVYGIKDSCYNNYKERIKIVEKYKKKYFCGMDKIFLEEIKKGKKLDLISGTLNFLSELWKKEKYDKIEEIVKKIEEIENYISFPTIAKYALSYFYPLINFNEKLPESSLKKLEELLEIYKKIKK